MLLPAVTFTSQQQQEQHTPQVQLLLAVARPA
jgi:hypothetical protein